MIAVIDYGMGNLRSVQKALEAASARAKVISHPQDLKEAEKIVFPGVGAFGAAMRELRRLGLIGPIKDAIEEGKPFLGLCLGLQLLFERSEEAPGVRGLSILKGAVRRFRFTRDEGPASPKLQRGERGTRDDLKVPHMGWNNIVARRSSLVANSKILSSVPDGAYMYFVHSYYVVPKDEDIILTTTDYGGRFVSGIVKDNIYAFQFHPEKSQNLGLRILKNFVRL